jgi:cytochrome c-type biogenesis protein CcmF
MLGDLFLKAALGLGIILALALALEELGRVRISKKRYAWAMRGVTALVTSSLGLLFYAFYRPDFNVNYVFSRVATDTPLIYRLSALWVGQEGVFLVWAWAIFLCALVFTEKLGFDKSFNKRTHLILILLGTFFIVLAIMMSPFTDTTAAMGEDVARAGVALETALLGLEANGFYKQGVGFVEGQGMSPILMSPWMALHPPIVFIAYALAAIPFGVCLVYLFNRRGEWEQTSRQWARLSWIFLSAGLIIGSLWAYEELSFGSYWTWDPIETASLIPWLTLTIFLHGSHEHRRKGTFGIIAPIVGVLTTILIIYGTFITKSGLIESSHAYGKSIITPFLASAIVLSIAVLIFTSARLYLKEKKAKREWGPLVSTTNTFYLSVVLFTLILVVLMWGITYPLFAKITAEKTVSIGKVFYNTKGYPVTAGVVLVSGFCLLLGVLKKGSALAVSGGVLAMSLAGYVLKPTGSYYVDTFIPIGLVAVAAVVLRLQKELTSSKNVAVIIKNVSGHLLHLGIAVMFIGVVASGSLQKGRDVIYSYPDEINTMKDARNGYSIQLTNLFVFQDPKGNWVQQANVTLYREGANIGDLSLTMINDRRYGRRPKVSIRRGLSSDVYAVYYGISGGHGEQGVILPINVKVNPYVSLVWAGSILSVLALVVIFAIEAFHSKS